MSRPWLHSYWVLAGLLALLVACDPGNGDTLGVDLLIGTRSYGTEVDGTGFVVYYQFPTEGLAAGDVQVTIRGPAGWNGDQPLTRQASSAGLQDGWTASSVGTTPLVGTYEMEVVVQGATTYTATAQLTQPDFAFPGAQGIVVEEASSSRVQVEWDAPAGAVSYTVALWRGVYEERVAGYHATVATEFEFVDLDLPPGGYTVEVDAWPVDLTATPQKVEPFGFSYADQQFEVPADPAAVAANSGLRR